MTKANITQYSSTASSNTDIDDINIDENCPASGLNNALRSLMAHLKNVDTGSQALTALSVTGNVSVGGTFTSRGIDDNADALAITIDSSENVMISKTSSSITNTGTTFEASGRFFSTADGQEVSILNRQSSDGEILQFRKDNTTTVGSIGAVGGDIYLGTGTNGFRFLDQNNAIIPVSSADGSTNTNAIDLGASFGRYKDLYLSGGVFLGGTGSANQISDYEEGNWTMTDQSGASLSITVYVSSYTKIGNQVFFEFGMVFPTTSDTNPVRLSLPFTAKATSDNTGGGGITTTNSGRNDTLVVLRNTSTFGLQNNINQSATNANYSGKQLRAAGQYTV